jgi:hypothetical protein
MISSLSALPTLTQENFMLKKRINQEATLGEVAR